jgi:rhodanese-related sulfurtransferase
MQRQYIRIGPVEAKSRVDHGKAVILDVVAPDSWAIMRRQIANAIRIEPEDFATYYKDILPLDKQIIAYCT